MKKQLAGGFSRVMGAFAALLILAIGSYAFGHTPTLSPSSTVYKNSEVSVSATATGSATCESNSANSRFDWRRPDGSGGQVSDAFMNVPVFSSPLSTKLLDISTSGHDLNISGGSFTETGSDGGYAYETGSGGGYGYLHIGVDENPSGSYTVRIKFKLNALCGSLPSGMKTAVSHATGFGSSGHPTVTLPNGLNSMTSSRIFFINGCEKGTDAITFGFDWWDGSGSTWGSDLGECKVTSTVSLSTGTWYEVVGRYDATNDGLYITVKPEGSSATSTWKDTSGSDCGYGIGPWSGGGGSVGDGLYIGATWIGWTGAGKLDGFLDEFLYYWRKLTDDEVGVLLSDNNKKMDGDTMVYSNGDYWRVYCENKTDYAAFTVDNHEPVISFQSGGLQLSGNVFHVVVNYDDADGDNGWGTCEWRVNGTTQYTDSDVAVSDGSDFTSTFTYSGTYAEGDLVRVICGAEDGTAQASNQDDECHWNSTCP